LGIHPRDVDSLFTIFTAPIIHASWNHLISNSIPVLVLGTVLFVIYNKTGIFIWLLIHIFTGLMVWAFARNSYHVGASGMVYGVASFLFFSGLFRLDTVSMAISALVALLYGGMVWGVLPLESGISWESHLFGGIVGVVLAYLFRNTDRKNLPTKDEKLEYKTFRDYLKDIAEDRKL
jgi:membrane associated rhomboid family serine protease